MPRRIAGSRGTEIHAKIRHTHMKNLPKYRALPLIFAVFLGGIWLSAGNLAHADVCLSGWGTPTSGAGALSGQNINVTWSSAGTYGGKEYYTNAGLHGEIAWSSAASFWAISDNNNYTLDPATGNIASYSTSGVATPDLASGWVAYNISFTGTISDGGCSAPPPPPAAPQMFTATSSCVTVSTETPITASTSWTVIASSTCGILYGVLEIDWTQIGIIAEFAFALASFIVILWLFHKKI